MLYIHTLKHSHSWLVYVGKINYCFKKKNRNTNTFVIPIEAKHKEVICKIIRLGIKYREKMYYSKHKLLVIWYCFYIFKVIFLISQNIFHGLNTLMLFLSHTLFLGDFTVCTFICSQTEIIAYVDNRIFKPTMYNVHCTLYTHIVQCTYNRFVPGIHSQGMKTVRNGY